MAIGHGCRPSWVGVGRVVAVGAGVRQLKEGDRTRVPVLHPCGAERIKPDGPWLRPLPPGDINQVRHNGRQSADRLSPGDRHRNLPRGSWVTQNGASSGVGWATVAIAKSLGLRAVNLVRRDEVVEEMKALGGDSVLEDGSDLAKRVAAETGSAPGLQKMICAQEMGELASDTDICICTIIAIMKCLSMSIGARKFRCQRTLVKSRQAY